MANEKLTQLPSLSAASGNTLFYVVDVSDPTDDPTGSSKQITRDNILKNITGLTIDGDVQITGNTYVTGKTETNGITSTGGVTFKQVTINSTYSATTQDYMIDVTGGTFTVYLPSAVGIQGRLLVVKNNGGGAVTVQPISGQDIDGKSFVILGETNTIQLASNGSNWVAISYNISTVNSSTGVFEFTGLTIASPTTFTVAPVKGWIVDDTTNPLSPQLYYIYYSGGTHTATYVTTATETWVYLTSGGTISQSNIELTEEQRRQNIFLGKLGHANKTNIINAFSQPDFVLSPLSQLRDMFTPINLINGGIYASPNGVNLSFNTSAGYLYGLGINFANDTLSPNSIYVSGTNPCTFQYRTQTGGTASNTTFIDPTNYDVGGAVTPISGTKATNQRIYLVQNGIFRVQYGQTEYQQLTAAIEGIATEQFNTFSNFTNNGILIGILSVLSTATDLSDTSKARFFFASKFGETVGSAGGVSTTNLQQAYNNSVTPEITTNSTLGPVSIKNGSGTADNVTSLFETLNSGGTVTMFVRADGSISANTITATTVSATTYQNLPIDPDTYVTGFTYNDNEFVIKQNNGQPDLTVVINSVTGWTVNGDLNVTGNTTLDGLTATTVSATTYQNLPIDPDTYVTAFTYNDNVFTISQNNGQPDLTALINTVTGWTVNGELTVTGNTSLQAFTGTSGTINGDLTVTGNTTVRGNLVVSGNTGVNWFSSNTSSDLVRITQTGSGNAFVVEDLTNPDSTPFVIDSSGNVAIGKTSVTSGTLVDLEVAGKTIGINIGNSNTSFMAGTGIFSYGNGIGINVGRDDFGTVVGIKGESVFDISADPSATYYGGEFISSGQGGRDYAVRLSDGTEGVGKFLYSVDANGSANWTSQLSGTSATINGPLTVTGNTTLRATTASTLNVTGNTIVDGTISGGTMVITTTPTNENTNTQILSRNPTTGAIEYVDASSTPIGTYNYGISYTMFTGNYMV
jgi:hypothetical protein